MNRKTIFTAILMLVSYFDTYAQQVKKEKNIQKEMTFQQMFQQGEKLPAEFSKHFIDQTYLAPLTRNKTLNVPVSNVSLSHTTATLYRLSAYTQRDCLFKQSNT